MRVVIFINNDLTSHTIFSGVMCDSDIKVSALCVTTSITKNKQGKNQGALALLKKCAFQYWLFLAFYNGLFRLFQLNPFSKASKCENFEVSNLIKIAKERKIPIYYSDNFSSPLWIKKFRDLRPDRFLIRINQIFSKELLKVPKENTVCVHSSVLPSYKGIAAEFHSMKNQEEFIGTSLFEVTPELDKGPVLSQKEIPIDYSKDLFSNIVRNNALGKELLMDYLKTRTCYSVSKIPQKSYYSWPNAKDLKKFKSKKLSLIKIKNGLEIVL